MNDKKILVIGIDGLDPSLTRKYVDEGRMPATKKLLEMGSARHDLVMLGSHPPITPPQWTTLACGCNPYVHGITDYYRNVPEGHEYMGYNLDSRFCEAEQIWNVTAEAGYKTLVWHWPGSSWPPTSDSENLHVIDGTQPTSVNCGIATVDSEFILSASEKIEAPTYNVKAASDAKIPCVQTDLKVSGNSAAAGSIIEGTLSLGVEAPSMLRIPLDDAEGQAAISNSPYDVVLSPMKDPSGWAYAPEGAREFIMLLSQGLIRRPCLLLKDENGEYSQVAVYRSKKDEDPLFTLDDDVFTTELIDQAVVNDEYVDVTRNMRVVEIAPDGSGLKMWVSNAMQMNVDTLFHPTRLYRTIVDNIGYPPPLCNIGAGNEKLIRDVMIANWDHDLQWNADGILKLIEVEDYQVVFSQVHNVDALGHMILRYMKERPDSRLPEETYQELFAKGYEDTDKYIARFLPLVDEGWDIFVVSDHAQITNNYQKYYADGIGMLYQLGYTALVKDENGNPVKQIDYEHTTAIANRSNGIYINLKGREPHGIVDPADKYELEERIITDLYGYKDPGTGHRVVSVALRNKDAVILGLGGKYPQGADIIYLFQEGFCTDHGDSLSTAQGYADTSVSPIFIAAGPDIKTGFETERVIRQVDLAPTVSEILGVRKTEQCEGAPVYQILK